MRTRVATFVACLLLASCGSGDGAGTDPGTAGDAGANDPGGIADPGIADPGLPDPGDRDPGGDDGAPDALPDDTFRDPGAVDAPPADGGTDASGDLPACPANCAKECAHGFRTAEDGCPACACRECGQDGDCVGRDPGTCPALRCSEGGTCVCDCSMVDPAIYACPDGTIVPRCGCTAIGLTCLDHPESQCPTICTPGSDFTFPCPAGNPVPWCDCKAPTCVPECRQARGKDPSGWYDPCDGTLLAEAACAGCRPLCQNIGTRSEAWHDACSGARIAWAQCAARLDCGDAPIASCAVDRCVPGRAADAPCPGGGTVPLCACDGPAPACVPECRATAGDDPEGWYDCKGTLIRAAACTGCAVDCDRIGSKSEGWYSSCDGLIAWDTCATGTWACATVPPLDLCTAPVACLGSGPDDAAPLAGGPWPECCPGLARLVPAIWDEALHRCDFPDDPVEIETAFFRCGLCGDGTCRPPENRCNCPADCLAPMAD